MFKRLAEISIISIEKMNESPSPVQKEKPEQPTVTQLHSIGIEQGQKGPDIIMMSESDLEQEYDLKVVTIVSNIMEGIIDQMDQPEPDSSLFTGNTVPDISIKDYMLRIKKHCRFSVDCIIMALIYIDRYTLSADNLVLSLYNVHRLLLVTLLLASKYHDDLYFNNKTFAFVGGITPRELNELELHLLAAIDFDMYINPEDFAEYKCKLLEQDS